MEFKATPENGIWVLPSKRRPHNLKRIFQAMKDTNMTTPGVVIIEEGEFNELVDEYSKLELPKDWVFWLSDGDYPGDKYREFGDSDHYRRCEWIGTLSDDHLPITPNWDLMLLNDLNGKNYVSSNDEDNTLKGRITGGVVFSRAVLDIIGGHYPLEIKHYFVDDLFEQFGRICDCWIVRQDIIVHHLHHSNKKAEMDDTYRHSGAIIKEDAREWMKWILLFLKSSFR